jgi:hypothetical protein
MYAGWIIRISTVTAYGQNSMVFVGRIIVYFVLLLLQG